MALIKKLFIFIQVYNMPRTLNVEKLDKKFASLTRSRESIQGLSSWIMHHKEFYQEIVEEWLKALKKDDVNALNMFYVANDVIQHCGKKKAPEYRTAFSTVLEKALSLAKVKEIRNEVSRMMTLWHDKEIYDDNFFQLLENTLNNEPSPPEISDEEKELSDFEIVSTFKLQNLIDALENLKKITDEVSSKEAKLKNMKCPENLNVEDLIVRMDKKDTYKQYKKADAYCKYVDDLIASFILLNDAREDALKYLKYTTVFYTTQNEEVKKVVHAYRIYGKKLKIMEKSLSEKMSVLRELFPSPVPESPSSDHSIEFSPPLDSPTLNLNQELVNTAEGNLNSPSFNTECTEDSNYEIYVPNESPSEKAEGAESVCLKDASLLPATDAKDVQNMEVTASDIPSRLKQEDSDISEAKNAVDSNTKDSELSKKTDVAAPAEDLTDIDFLLEKAYDERKVKKANIKRKIETLLKTKGGKACKVSDSEKDDQNESNESKLPTKAVTMEDSCDGNNFEIPTAEVSKEETLHPPLFQDADKVSVKENFQTDNSIDLENEKESQEQDVSKIDDCQSKTLKNDTDAKDENTVPKICAPAPQTLSEIPLELLKSILDKNILNSSQEAVLPKGDNNGENDEKVCVTNDACSVVPMPSSENQEEISSADLKPDKSVKQTKSSRNVLTKSVTSCEELTKFKEENELLDEITNKIDKESTAGETKLPNAMIESIDTKRLIDDEQSNSSVSKTDALDSVKSSNFLETLGTTIKCLTVNNLSVPQFKGTEKQMSESGFSDTALENSLRLYNFILQCHQAMGSREDRADNEMSNRSETIGTVPAAEDLGVCVNTTKLPENASGESSKHDNLELMDMDVDSEDDS